MSCASAASFLANFPQGSCDSAQQPRRRPAAPRLIWRHNNFVSAFDGPTGILEDLSGISGLHPGLGGLPPSVEISNDAWPGVMTV